MQVGKTKTVSENHDSVKFEKCEGGSEELHQRGKGFHQLCPLNQSKEVRADGQLCDLHDVISSPGRCESSGLDELESRCWERGQCLQVVSQVLASAFFQVGNCPVPLNLEF